MKDFFKLRGRYPNKISLLIGVLGFLTIIGIWGAITKMEIVPHTVLPPPMKVLESYKELHFEKALVRNVFFSLKVNFLGYIFAILISIPLGLIIGLNGFLNAFIKRPIEGFRFIPLSAVVILFIAWFGIDVKMKVAFLAFGIIVYLLPTVIKRVEDVDNVYVDTMNTLNASNWQIIQKVFIPIVVSKVFEDIRMLVAISWTYIIIAEMLNKTGGIGSLIYVAQRQSRIDMVFALLMLIILIGFLQDKVFLYLDKILFPYKYAKENQT